MNRKDSPQSVIDSYRRRQQMAPFFMGALAVLLLVVGIVILIIWFTRSDGRPSIVASLLATPTPTVTITSTATATDVPPTATSTTTITLTPTITETAKPSGPFEYTVEDGDTCWDIAQKNTVGLDVLLAINTFPPGTCPIKPGDKIMIPLPDTQLPTETSIPTDARNLKIEYYVKEGETLAVIASRFNSTMDAIMKESDIEDANKITAGQKLIVPVNIVTPTVTPAPTNTITPGGPTFTNTPEPATATATP
jgi:LysM repeat protein